MDAPPTVERIEPLADRRTPTAIAWVRLGEAVVGFTVRSRRRGHLALIAPEAADRRPGVILPQATMDALADAIDAELRAMPALLKALRRSSAYSHTHITRLD